MKKLSLLLVAGSMALSAGAQSLLPSNTSRGMVSQKHEPARINAGAFKHNGNRTTSATSGWFEYNAYMDTIVALGSTVATNVGFSAPYLWNDTTSMDAYSSGDAFNTMVSYAYVFDPMFTGWGTYFDLPHITAADGYTMDSIALYGIFGTNPAKTSIVDTLKVCWVYGSVMTTGDDITRSEFDVSFAPASLLTSFGLSGTAADSLWFPLVKYDSAPNLAMGTTRQEQILTISNNPSSNTNINWGDTLSNGFMYHPFALPAPFVVPAGDVVGVTVSYKSGDASFAFGDVVFTSAGTYNYNMWRPILSYYSDGTGNPQYWNYNAADNNTGEYKTLPNFENGWGDVYVPMWAWNQGGGASTLQYPLMDLHIVKGPLAVENVSNINGVQAVPNPAANSTSINFKTATVSNVTVTLTDATGMVVATQHFDNVTNGKAAISTANLANGVYFYTVSANGKSSAGRVVIAH